VGVRSGSGLLDGLLWGGRTKSRLEKLSDIHKTKRLETGRLRVCEKKVERAVKKL
jgi:hypothetical protein